MSSTAALKQRAAHLGPDRRRPQVLDAALDIAVESGIAAVTVGSVADRLGVTRPVVYSCYSDRVELIESLLDRESELLLEGVVDALHSAHGQDPEAAFATGYQRLLSFVQDRPQTWRLLFSTTPDPAVAARFAIARQEAARASARWIGPAMVSWWDTKDLDRKLPTLIELFSSSCEAAVRTLLAEKSEWTSDELGAYYGRLITQAFRIA